MSADGRHLLLVAFATLVGLAISALLEAFTSLPLPAHWALGVLAALIVTTTWMRSLGSEHTD